MHLFIRKRLDPSGHTQQFSKPQLPVHVLRRGRSHCSGSECPTCTKTMPPSKLRGRAPVDAKRLSAFNAPRVRQRHSTPPKVRVTNYPLLETSLACAC